jgi:uncharacterized linocin/CFP29 family protein
MLARVDGGPATAESPKTFLTGTSGRWAAERFMAALKAGRPISPQELRTAELLFQDEWKVIDTAIIESAAVRLRGVADLIGAGLVKPIPNAMAKTIYEYFKGGDMDPAIVSLDGVTRAENDRMEQTSAAMPLPITHKDFYLNLRTLEASRLSGEGLDTTYLRVCGTKIAEETERMLFQGGKTFGALTIYGYTTHPNRNTTTYGTGGAWTGTKTGEQILADVLAWISIMNTDRRYGPFWIYVSSANNVFIQNDFKTASDKSIMARLLEIPEVGAIRVSEFLPSGAIVVVDPQPEVVQMLDGEALQSVQWDAHGGFEVHFKAFLIRADYAGRSGILHIS